MLGDRWNRIEEIFHAALERPLPERDAYLVHACGDDRTLRSEVESLLANDGHGGTTIDSLVSNDLKDLAQAQSHSDSGLQIGPYRLVRELDSGGMGVVHLAVRSDDHYFQVVAIKTIRKGLASPDLIQRFRAERQILATLTHPNIGAILDGGDTDDGRPYIVMEYVEGQPITIAAENRSLLVRQRIELFRSVCSAVHHAHQKLVIHRDIKPSNVLVTPEGIVKLIDFGVSKPLAPELIPGKLPKTESWQRFMTPDYASPEQIQGRELTTATDVYSLGVLLFELLTDSRPYTLHGLSPSAAERLVCEEETPRPSTVAKLTQRTRKEIAGDLDRIVLMTMDKDPSRRYPSAQHLDEDLLLFLQHKPILCCSSSPGLMPALAISKVHLMLLTLATQELP
jgi:eukaryotic-like serine/threonine-protein kinase